MSYYQSVREKGRLDYSINILSWTQVILFIVTSILAPSFAGRLRPIAPIAPVTLAQTSTDLERATRPQNTKNLEIERITHDGVERALNPGEILTITMEGTSGVQASFLIIGDKHTIREVRAREITPGTYQSKIPISPRERVVEGAVIGRLQRGKQVVYSAASNIFTHNRNRASIENNNPPASPSPYVPNESESNSATREINPDLRPQFVSHRNGETIDPNGFVLQGQTRPYAEVKITISSRLPLLGEFVQIEGDKLIEQTVRANSQGIFQLPIPPVDTAPSGLKYLITAVASLNNQISKSTQLTLTQP